MKEGSGAEGRPAGGLGHAAPTGHQSDLSRSSDRFVFFAEIQKLSVWEFL